MTQFFRNVMLPAAREESRRSRGNLAPPHLRRVLADGGCWLNDDDRRRINAWVDARPYLRTLCNFRAKLALLMERRDIGDEATGMAQWIREARDSDIGSLRAFAAELEGDAFDAPRTRHVVAAPARNKAARISES
jgi:stearoyl-CoA desaturase (delta-9 desaturase)